MTRNVFNMTISRSKQLLTYLVIIHTVTLITLLSLLGLTIWAVIFCLFMMLSFIHYCRQYQWLKCQSSVINIARDTDENWTLCHHSGAQETQLSLKSCVVTQQFIILNFQSTSAWKTRSLTIMGDSVDSDLFRQLRIYCRMPKTFQQ